MSKEFHKNLLQLLCLNIISFKFLSMIIYSNNYYQQYVTMRNESKNKKVTSTPVQIYQFSTNLSNLDKSSSITSLNL